MNWRIIRALVAKDLKIFFRNRFIFLITVLALITYAGVYLAMPRTVDETLEIGVHLPEMITMPDQVAQEGIAIEMADSIDELKEGVIEGRYIAGVALPSEIFSAVSSTEKPAVEVFFAGDVPEEVREAVIILIEEMTYLFRGQSLNLAISENILGPDMVGQQIPPRDRMIPLFAVLILVFEIIGLASLISEETYQKTLQALLVTPLNVRGFFLSKGITALFLTFVQAVLFMAVIGGLNVQPLPVLVALLLGSVLVIGISFLLATVSKDLMSVVGWGIPFLVVLVLPTFAVLSPGLMTGWIKIIPSYYLVNAVHLSANFGLGWAYVWQDIMILLGFGVVFVWLGIMAMRRKIR